MNPTQKSKLMDPKEKEERDEPKGYADVKATYDPDAKIAKAFFFASNGRLLDERHIVSLGIYHRNNTPGDVCGFKSEVARQLVSDRNAQYWTPGPEQMDESVKAWEQVQKHLSGRSAVVTK